ncbi:hypothetical protein Pmani_027127 [Petrolisthes manimaculis]|uniref:RRM domain-containing protein n=1 Tax=Petrolisthes manimaculis TaxID=1843537 RepID=A0AAE1P2U3_9EUCA|nr:hypothetical protein Pmani_027127 [Petrolisthes manimaculis]
MMMNALEVDHLFIFGIGERSWRPVDIVTAAAKYLPRMRRLKKRQGPNKSEKKKFEGDINKPLSGRISKHKMKKNTQRPTLKVGRNKGNVGNKKGKVNQSGKGKTKTKIQDWDMSIEESEKFTAHKENNNITQQQRKKVKLHEDEAWKETVNRLNERNSQTLYIRFPTILTVKRVEDVLKALGDVVAGAAVRLPRPPRKEPFKYLYCFIEFASKEEAIEKRDALCKVELKGEKFYADFLKARSENSDRPLDPFRLQVDNIALSTTKKDLKNTFNTAWKIIYANKDRMKAQRGFAQIIYKQKEEALKIFNTKNITVNGKEVRLTFAKRKKRDYKDISEDAMETEDDDSKDKDSLPPPAKRMKVI